MASASLATAALQHLGSASDIPTRVQALKRIKTDLNGHLSRKVEYVRSGLIPQLTEVLVLIAAHPAHDSGGTIQLERQQELQLTQTVQILCILVHGSCLSHGAISEASH
jgi:hypothetical protein